MVVLQYNLLQSQTEMCGISQYLAPRRVACLKLGVKLLKVGRSPKIEKVSFPLCCEVPLRFCAVVGLCSALVSLDEARGFGSGVDLMALRPQAC